MEFYLSVVIPAYNEEDRLPETLRNTIAFLRQQSYSSEIIVVDDGSGDKTRETAESFREDFPWLRVIKYNPNRGKGYAVKTGMLEARGSYRLFMDADYAVPIKYVTEFLRLASVGSQIVVASRGLGDSIIERHQPFVREKLGQLFGWLQRLVLSLPFKDTQCGFKLFEARTAEKLFRQIKYECAYFDTELLYIAHRSGIRIKEVPVKWRHDMQTRLPIGLARSIDLVKKLFGIRRNHKVD